MIESVGIPVLFLLLELICKGEYSVRSNVNELKRVLVRDREKFEMEIVQSIIDWLV